MLEIDDLLERPVEVVRHVGDLLEQALWIERHDPPRPSPVTSTSKSLPQDGQLTAARVCPSWLTRRKRSCKKARSEANSCSITPGVTSFAGAGPSGSRPSRAG